MPLYQVRQQKTQQIKPSSKNEKELQNVEEVCQIIFP